MAKRFVDSAGHPLAVGDHVMIYFGYNKLQPGVIKEIKTMSAKVLVDAWPSHPDPEVRYSLSKWKRGECMVKVPNPDRPYPPEVYGLLDKLIAENNNVDSPFAVRSAIGEIYKFWEKNRPMRLVTS